MKSLILVLLFCLSFNSYGLSYLNVCIGDATKVCKRDKSNVVPVDALCEVTEDLDAAASDYDLTIVGPSPDRPWAPSEVLAAGESIDCQLDSVRKQARIDAADEKVQSKIDALGVLKNQCKSVADPFRSAVCELLEAK